MYQTSLVQLRLGKPLPVRSNYKTRSYVVERGKGDVNARKHPSGRANVHYTYLSNFRLPSLYRPRRAHIPVRLFMFSSNSAQHGERHGGALEMEYDTAPLLSILSTSTGGTPAVPHRITSLTALRSVLCGTEYDTARVSTVRSMARRGSVRYGVQ